MSPSMQRSLTIMAQRDAEAGNTRNLALHAQVNRFRNIIGDPPPLMSELGWQLRDTEAIRAMRMSAVTK